MANPVDLEPQAKAVADANAAPPYLFELGPDQGRRTIDELQSGPVKKPTVDIDDTTVPGGPSGEVSVRILRPQGAHRPLPVIVYIHGAGWVFGNHHTHDRLIRGSPSARRPRWCSPTTAAPQVHSFGIQLPITMRPP